MSEGVTSSILLLLANTYGIILTLLGNIVIDNMGVLAFGGLSVALYLCGALGNLYNIYSFFVLFLSLFLTLSDSFAFLIHSYISASIDG